MFTAALFIIAKICKQQKCPSIGKWIKRLWYNEILFSDKRKKELPSYKKPCGGNVKAPC